MKTSGTTADLFEKGRIFDNSFSILFLIFVVRTISGVQTMVHMIHRHQMNFGQDVRLNKGVSLLTHELLNRWTDIFILPRTA